MLKVEGHSNLARDPKSGAIININRSEIEAARERKRLRADKAEEEKQLKADVSLLKNEMSEIKHLLGKLVEKI
jgi:hypothetical protein